MSQPNYLFTDGACSGNPGPGGFGSIIWTQKNEVFELGEFHPNTTNNRMEMMSVICGLKFLKNTPGDIWILTDSTYVIRGATQWVHGWKKKGWKTAEGKDVVNQDLWIELANHIGLRKKMGSIDWKYIRGHVGIPGNERCDKIAVSFSKQEDVFLFSGTKNEYSIQLENLPSDMELPPVKFGSKKDESSKTNYYLSFVNGLLQRHKTWAECEAKVKGRSGAKFKKVSNEIQEREILDQWGVPKDAR